MLVGGVSHSLQLITGLVVNSFITTNSHLDRGAYASYSLVSNRKNVFWLKQNFISCTDMCKIDATSIVATTLLVMVVSAGKKTVVPAEYFPSE